MQMLFQGVLAASLAASAAFATGDRPNFTGTWVLDPASPNANTRPGGLSLTIRQDADQIYLVEKSGTGTPVIEFTCAASGHTCELTDHGQKAQVSAWYNGNALVVMKTAGRKGDTVTKH